MTQRTRAERIVSDIELPAIETIKDLEAILCEAQNDPPDGAADGSIGPEAFEGLRRYIDSVKAAKEACRSFLAKL